MKHFEDYLAQEGDHPGTSDRSKRLPYSTSLDKGREAAREFYGGIIKPSEMEIELYDSSGLQDVLHGIDNGMLRADCEPETFREVLENSGFKWVTGDDNPYGGVTGFLHLDQKYTRLLDHGFDLKKPVQLVYDEDTSRYNIIHHARPHEEVTSFFFKNQFMINGNEKILMRVMIPPLEALVERDIPSIFGNKGANQVVVNLPGYT